MKGLFSVLKFEFLNRVSQKSIKVTTAIFMILVFGVTFVPRIMELFDNGKDELPSIGYVIENNAIDKSQIPSILNFADSSSYNSSKEMEKDIKDEKIDSGYVFYAPNKFKEVNQNTSMYNQNAVIVQENLSNYLRNLTLEKEGIDLNIIENASNQPVEFETVALGKDGVSGYFFAYFGMFIVYMIVLLFGNSVATLVAREKSDRTMEILITTTGANNLIIGKVFASTIVSFLQLFLILASGIIGFLINKTYYSSELISMIKDSVNAESLVVFMLFIVLGCLMYFFLYAAFGALVSKVEEVQNATAPIQVIFMASFVATVFGLQVPDSTIMKVASMVPFSSPMSFFVRYTMTDVPMYQTLIAVSLLIITTVVLAFISIRIYRMGTLNYGNKMSFGKTVKKLFEKED